MVTRRGLLLGLTAAAAAARELRFERVLYLGATRVRVVVAEVEASAKRDLIYYHPYENEHSSAVVTRHAIKKSGGRLIEIRSRGDRLISFVLNGAIYKFDPSRMFTDAGLEHSLTSNGPYTKQALDTAKILRNQVIAQFSRGSRPIISVHNGGGEGVNALAYRKGGALEAQALRVAINPQEKAGDFFVLSDERIFSRLHHAGFNTVLLPLDIPDDGTLAVLCRRHRWPYVRLEAADGDLNQQARMLSALPAVFS